LTLNATPDLVEEALTPRTKAVISVHFGGRPMAVGELVSRLDRQGIPVVEDAAHAFPSPIPALDNRLAGTIGRVGAFSFYATKTITTGEGGMLVTDDNALADRARLMSLHGISRHAWNRYAAGGSWSYEIEDAGYKYNMTDLAAALGIAQLSRADELLAARRSLAAGYLERFRQSGLEAILELPGDAPDGSHAWHLFVVRLRAGQSPVSRAEVMDQLAQNGIGASVHFIPLHLHPYYRARPETTPRPLPVATGEFERVFSLPLWPGLTDSDLDRVVDTLAAILRRPRA
jgi:dTDP-4-amino-4,6-dideoxygalactose transaminase